MGSGFAPFAPLRSDLGSRVLTPLIGQNRPLLLLQVQVSDVILLQTVVKEGHLIARRR